MSIFLHILPFDSETLWICMYLIYMKQSLVELLILKTCLNTELPIAFQNWYVAKMLTWIMRSMVKVWSVNRKWTLPSFQSPVWLVPLMHFSISYKSRNKLWNGFIHHLEIRLTSHQTIESLVFYWAIGPKSFDRIEVTDLLNLLKGLLLLLLSTP